jgi:cell division protein FtsI/penicillin-binding protein 2
MSVEGGARLTRFSQADLLEKMTLTWLTPLRERLKMKVPVAPRNATSFFPFAGTLMPKYYSRLFCVAVAVAVGLVSAGAQTTSTKSTSKSTTKKRALPPKSISAKSSKAAVTRTKPAATVAKATPKAQPKVVATLTPEQQLDAANKRERAARGKGWVQTWDEPTYKDSTVGDNTAGEDPIVRAAAIEALGSMNGSIVVVDPETGRVLTVVNQQLALGGGFQPCSTVKVSVALAGLRENLVTRTSPVRFNSRGSFDLTDALAYSNNAYFANLGIKLGYDRYSHYARLFGYGEKAGLNIEGEHPGYFPPAPPKDGGMGMLTSFGEEISQTPLELAALMSAVANGGTLYWMQYPRSEQEARDFQPQVKRRLDIENLVSTIKPGLRGAVDFGTARRASQEDEILGKTGTCSEGRTHLGWFGSFNENGGRRLVVVVLLTGGRPSIGAMASGVAGDVYKQLAARNFFRAPMPVTPASILPTQICCSR